MASEPRAKAVIPTIATVRVMAVRMATPEGVMISDPMVPPAGGSLVVRPRTRDAASAPAVRLGRPHGAGGGSRCPLPGRPVSLTLSWD